MKWKFLVLLIVIISACSKAGRNNIESVFIQSKSEINFETIVTGSWERLCVFAPYSNNASAEKVLGFEWDLEEKSNIMLNEGINLLVFSRNNKVLKYVEISRKKADFAHLGGQCFKKGKTVFIREGKFNEWPKWNPKA